MEGKLIQFTDELWAAIDRARGHQSRAAWLEHRLRKLAAVRSAAEELGLEFQERPKVGVYDRSYLVGKPRGTRIPR